MIAGQAPRRRKPPKLDALLAATLNVPDRPVAFVLAGHNGSGKSTLWYERLAPTLKIPLINADRLTLSILPSPDSMTNMLPGWATKLRDTDQRWQKLSQEGVQLFMGLIMDKKMPFAFETVFSHFRELENGKVESKIDQILALQKAGYYVVLLFVGLMSTDISILRVKTRHASGGHSVPADKLLERFPRTQKAVASAAPIADMTLMFDNSRDISKAFTLVRAQAKKKVLFDCRASQFIHDASLLAVAEPWLSKIAKA